MTKPKEAYPNGHPKWFFGFFNMHCYHEVSYAYESEPLKAHGPFAPPKHRDFEVEKQYWMFVAPTCCICGRRGTSSYGTLISEQLYSFGINNGSIRPINRKDL